MPIPVISVGQMREWEQATWAAGQTKETVIACVGELVARRALKMTRETDYVLVLAGKGHNGDDARMARPHLEERRVELLEVADPAAALPQLMELLRQQPALLIDGLFGIGLNRPLDAAWVQFIEAMNQSGVPTLAVDVPSGLDADSGEMQGAAVRATVTLTLGAAKRGLVTVAAARQVGRLEVAPDIGLIPCPLRRGDTPEPLQWTLPEDLSGFPPPRFAAGHKGMYGHLGIVAGSLGYHGAAVLAARGAQRARPGLITLCCQPGVYGPVATQLQAVMVRPWNSELVGNDLTGVLAGPGLAAKDIAEPVRSEVRRLWTTLPQPMVVDASALDWLRPDPFPEGAVRVITPHPGEAARLLRTTAAEVQSNRARALRQLSAHFGDCWVILKGSQTLIGRFTGDIHVNPTGNAELAQGGTGDILAGYCAGWLAQFSQRAHPLPALRYAVWQHGAAADRLSARGRHWVVEELIEELANVSQRTRA